MALLDQLQRMEQHVARRLRELEPLMTECEELKKVAERLGLSGTDNKPAASPPRRSRRASASRVRATATTGPTKGARSSSRRATKTRGARRRNAAAPGSRQQDVLRVVRERPGISVAELGRELGVDPTSLYQIVRRLEGRGEIRKDGRQLRPLTAEAAATADQPPADRAT